MLSSCTSAFVKFIPEHVIEAIIYESFCLSILYQLLCQIALRSVIEEESS